MSDLSASTLIYEDHGPWSLYIVNEPDEPEWFADFANQFGEAEARRVTACWNACAGIPTESLEAGVVADLVTACQGVQSWIEFFGPAGFNRPDEPEGWIAHLIAAALAKLEAGS